MHIHLICQADLAMKEGRAGRGFAPLDSIEERDLDLLLLLAATTMPGSKSVHLIKAAQFATFNLAETMFVYCSCTDRGNAD